jgi:hypothetical protein
MSVKNFIAFQAWLSTPVVLEVSMASTWPVSIAFAQVLRGNGDGRGARQLGQALGGVVVDAQAQAAES